MKTIKKNTKAVRAAKPVRKAPKSQKTPRTSRNRAVSVASSRTPSLAAAARRKAAAQGLPTTTRVPASVLAQQALGVAPGGVPSPLAPVVSTPAPVATQPVAPAAPAPKALPPLKRIKSCGIKLATVMEPTDERPEGYCQLLFVGMEFKEHLMECSQSVFQQIKGRGLERKRYHDFNLSIDSSSGREVIVAVSAVPKPEAASHFDTSEDVNSKFVFVSVGPEGVAAVREAPPSLDEKSIKAIEDAITAQTRRGQAIKSASLLAGRWYVKGVNEEDGETIIKVALEGK